MPDDCNLMVYVSNVSGFLFAIHGLRSSYNSQDQSDSADWPFGDKEADIGPKDLKLMRTLIKSGDSHAKFARHITVRMSVRAPRFWWAEFDTYKIGVEKMSESTMHTLMRGVTEDDFTLDTEPEAIALVQRLIAQAAPLHKVKSNLPEGFRQRRYITTNYQALRNVWRQRRLHKLQEWSELLGQARIQLPYADDLIFVE